MSLPRDRLRLLICGKGVLEDRLQRDERHRCLPTYGLRASSGCFAQYHANYPRCKRLVQQSLCQLWRSVSPNANSLTSWSVLRSRLAVVQRRTVHLPRLVVPPMGGKPRQSKVSGFPWPRLWRRSLARWGINCVEHGHSPALIPMDARGPSTNLIHHPATEG